VDNQPVVCPSNPVWLAKMLDVLPPGLRGKLAVYENCPSVQAVQQGQGVGQRRSNGSRRDIIRPVLR